MVPDVGPGAKIYSVRKRWGDWVIKVILRILKALHWIKSINKFYIKVIIYLDFLGKH